jgi:hypothetical protein
LPEFADLASLPAPDWGAVKFEAEKAEGLGGGKAIGARWGASQTFGEQVDDLLGPGFRCVLVARKKLPARHCGCDALILLTCPFPAGWSGLKFTDVFRPARTSS